MTLASDLGCRPAKCRRPPTLGALPPQRNGDPPATPPAMSCRVSRSPPYFQPCAHGAARLGPGDHGAARLGPALTARLGSSLTLTAQLGSGRALTARLGSALALMARLGSALALSTRLGSALRSRRGSARPWRSWRGSARLTSAAPRLSATRSLLRRRRYST